MMHLWKKYATGNDTMISSMPAAVINREPVCRHMYTAMEENPAKLKMRSL